jgi:hypothetical protein
MDSTDTVGAGWSIDFGLAAMDHTSEVVHPILRL